MKIPSLHNLSLHVPISMDMERMKQNLNHLAQVERLAKERADKERSRNLPRRAGDPDPLAEPGGPLPRLAFEDGQMRALPRPPKRPYEQETFDEQERLRNPEPKCSNATCPGPSPDKPFIAYDDGSSVCHACGGETPAAPSHKNEAPNHEDGPDRRRAQEYGDDENLDLYTIDDEEMPGATEHQRWWANNRMNQAMVLADCMGYDRDDPDGFSISADEVLKVKHVLRRVCPLAAPDAPDATVEDNDDASLMGSPTLWAILIGLEVIAQGPDGFQMPTKTKQQIATLEGLNEYLYKFQGRSTPRFEEALRFFTAAKGKDVKDAQRKLDKIKVRWVTWHSIGPNNALRRAKINKLNELIKRSNVFGPNVGLSDAVMTGQPPALAPAPLYQQRAAAAADALHSRLVAAHNLPHVDRIRERGMGWTSRPNPSVGGADPWGGPEAPTTEPPSDLP